MHRLTIGSLALALLAATGCGGGGKPAESPEAEAKGEGEGEGDTAAKDSGGEGSDTGGQAAQKKDECLGFDIPSLADTLDKSACEVADATPDTLPPEDLKGKVEVRVTSSPTHVAPGAKADLLVSFMNKTKQPITLRFRIDPTARFEAEVYDKKDKRADMPKGDPPPPPKGQSQPEPFGAKVARVTIAPNGSARQTVPWEAVKTKWAPEKVRGTSAERGFPRKPAGPLPKGKYTVKVVTPLVGVTEGEEHELSAPKVEIEVG